MTRYHDEEWGVPVHEDRKWFEFMVLEKIERQRHGTIEPGTGKILGTSAGALHQHHDTHREVQHDVNLLTAHAFALLDERS